MIQRKSLVENKNFGKSQEKADAFDLQEKY